MTEEDNTLYHAMNLFADISQAVAFTANEVALFHVLLHTWNAARRPAVIEQWAQTTCHRSGMSVKALREARNKLVQRGVLFFEKGGNRKCPRYSLHALLDKPDPLLSPQASKSDTKGGSKPDSKGSVKGTLLTREDKEKGKDPPKSPKGDWEGLFPNGSLNKSKTDQKRMRVLRPNDQMKFIGQWFGRKPETLWSVAEAKALRDLDPSRDEVIEMKQYRDTPNDFHRRDLLTLLNNWGGELDRARSQKMNQKKSTDPTCGVTAL